MRKPMSLYIHIPFCTSKCVYCNFVSKVGSELEKERYVKNLIEEIKMRAKIFNPRYEISTIYIGGGTPSCMKNGIIRRILQEVYSSFTVRNKSEITVEVNPESVTKEKIAEYVGAGVNRISMGLQCAQNGLLGAMGRTHTVADFEKAIEMIRAVGMQNISSDIMLGFPNQKLQDVSMTVQKLVSMGIPHISAYMLSVEDGTKLSSMLSDGEVKIPNEKLTISMYREVVSLLRKSGYVRYEASNFAKIGYRSVHNMTYWKRGDYLGIGASAHSFIDGTRLANIDSVSEYNLMIEKEKKAPIESSYRITKEEAEEEFIMLSLRMEDGIDTVQYEKEFNKNFFAEKKKKLKDLITLGMVVIDGDHLKATDKGFLVLNRIVLELVS